MNKVAFSTTPPMVWNDGEGNRSILESMERLVLRARATDTSINHGEWEKIWKAVYNVMGGSEPTEVCDPNKQGAAYLDALIVALGGTTASTPITRNVYKMNGSNQYIDAIKAQRFGSFLLAFTFYATSGFEQELTSHDVDGSYLRVTAAGDLLVQIGNGALITVPAVTLGDISTPKRIEVGRLNNDVRVRVDGVDAISIANHGNSRFGVRYIGANQGLTAFSDGAFYDIQFTNQDGDHFYIADDLSATLADTGTSAEDGTIINYNPANWVEI